MLDDLPGQIVSFWFDDAAQSPGHARRRDSIWFERSAEFDLDIERRFSAAYSGAARGELHTWSASPGGGLALILLLDQFPRNMFRGTSRAFATDALALRAAIELIDSGGDTSLDPLQRLFAYMPFQHAEDNEMQALSLRKNGELLASVSPDWRELFEMYYRYAELHSDIIRRFGRFPHRNRVLGRQSTPDEMAYLVGGAETFGQG
ncbi:MAG TPA: DUF924 family protein [Haliangium sp.]|nr:DUF924 family protein [Haliangium sp.]